ncbi:MAG TPA: hypothetical protein VG122_05540 [Gemmata sp.]|jgi:lipopolysaccharide assembly outer membrane protein LptD (OstA)|nr:hypothetical protein [Gemmata sp.]
MLIALFSLMTLGIPSRVEEPTPADQLPEIKICVNNGNVEVRIGDYTITGSRITIDPNLQRITVEGGDIPAILTRDSKTSSGKKIAYNLVSKRYTVYKVTDDK